MFFEPSPIDPNFESYLHNSRRHLQRPLQGFQGLGRYGVLVYVPLFSSEILLHSATVPSSHSLCIFRHWTNIVAIKLALLLVGH